MMSATLRRGSPCLSSHLVRVRPPARGGHAPGARRRSLDATPDERTRCCTTARSRTRASPSASPRRCSPAAASSRASRSSARSRARARCAGTSPTTPPSSRASRANARARATPAHGRLRDAARARNVAATDSAIEEGDEIPVEERYARARPRCPTTTTRRAQRPSRTARRERRRRRRARGARRRAIAGGETPREDARGGRIGTRRQASGPCPRRRSERARRIIERYLAIEDEVRLRASVDGGVGSRAAAADAKDEVDEDEPPPPRWNRRSARAGTGGGHRRRASRRNARRAGRAGTFCRTLWAGAGTEHGDDVRAAVDSWRRPSRSSGEGGARAEIQRRTSAKTTRTRPRGGDARARRR